MFVVAFGAATILPFQSEILFVALQLRGTLPIAEIVLVASIGNTLGACVNYAMGRTAERFKQSRWFPVSEKTLRKAQKWFARWGVWLLLLSWAPLGDAVTVVAGIMRTRLWLFLLLVAIAKTGRYVVLAWLTIEASSSNLDGAF